MPRFAPLARKRRPKTITKAQIFHLIRGFDYFSDFPFENEEHRRALWAEHRTELMAREAESEDELGTYENPLFPLGEKPAAYFDYELEATHA